MTKQSRQYYVYFITNKTDSTIYVGVTNDLVRRIYEHKNKLLEGFSSRYNLCKLVYFEVYDSIEEAIKREKQIKAGSRQIKNELVNKSNLQWRDLYEEICK